VARHSAGEVSHNKAGRFPLAQSGAIRLAGSHFRGNDGIRREYIQSGAAVQGCFIAKFPVAAPLCFLSQPAASRHSHASGNLSARRTTSFPRKWESLSPPHHVIPTQVGISQPAAPRHSHASGNPSGSSLPRFSSRSFISGFLDLIISIFHCRFQRLI
jgi:hypothetical protein